MAESNNINDIEEEEEQQPASHVNKKKIIIFLLPTLIAIGIVVGMHHTFDSSNQNISGQPYSILERPGAENGAETVVFYDIPPISVPLKNPDGTQDVINFKVSIELTNKNDIPNIEVLLPRLYNVIISHTRELTKEEVQGAEGLYWLKEELLYRLNLAAAPINISDIDFKSIEINKN